MQLNRKLSEQELRLLQVLASKASINLPEDWFDTIRVNSMNDDGMGSLRLFPKGIVDDNRMFDKQVSECHFIDIDGIKVIASLNVDNKGSLYEIDIWKTDYTPLIQIPESFE